MGSSKNQPRKPKGRPAGGEWVPTQRSEQNQKLQVDGYQQVRLENRHAVPQSGRYEVTFPNGLRCWYEDGEFHRDGGEPAVVRPDGTRTWYRHGKPHRDGGPAIVGADGGETWMQNGDIHRDGGPAMTIPADPASDDPLYGSHMQQVWYQHGKIDRPGGGPAVVTSGPQGWTEEWKDGRRVSTSEVGPVEPYPS